MRGSALLRYVAQLTMGMWEWSPRNAKKNSIECLTFCFGSATLMRGRTSRAARIYFNRNILVYWLCHADARQVSDLPESHPFFSGSATQLSKVQGGLSLVSDSGKAAQMKMSL